MTPCSLAEAWELPSATRAPSNSRRSTTSTLRRMPPEKTTFPTTCRRRSGTGRRRAGWKRKSARNWRICRPWTAKRPGLPGGRRVRIAQRRQRRQKPHHRAVTRIRTIPQQTSLRHRWSIPRELNHA